MTGSSQSLTQLQRASAAGVLCALLAFLLHSPSNADEPTQSVSVPVISGPAPAENADMPVRMIPPADDTIQPTLPGGRLPQYQLSPHRSSPKTNEETAESVDDSTLRVLLALPAEPVLVEVTLTIDGEPFRRRRETRVRAALQAALEPEVQESVEPPAEPVPNATAESTSADGADEADETEDAPSVVSYRSAASASEKLRRYIAAVGREPTLAEVRRFFDHRLDGPVVLPLRDGFQAFRSGEMPVFQILDRDRNGVISADEITGAAESFLECDLNRNEVVDYREIGDSANDARRQAEPRLDAGTVLSLIPDEQSAAATYAALLASYGGATDVLPERWDPNANGRWEPEELDQLRRMPADLQLTVNFQPSAPDQAQLAVSADSLQRLTELGCGVRIVESSIVISRPDCDLWLSAIQREPGDQISLGAVNDGYPLLPALDANNDGRFTLRELRQIAEAVRRFDVDGDGQIRREELRPAVRVAFGLGPHVHQTLAGVRSEHPPTPASVAGPEWFVRMDRNRDNDLTRTEFPGTDEQFARLDADGDELISADEALEFDRKSSSDGTPQPKPEPDTTNKPQEGDDTEPSPPTDNPAKEPSEKPTTAA